jgi:Carboxypeptidase regulatory-like domain/TonB dependent receptor
MFTNQGAKMKRELGWEPATNCILLVVVPLLVAVGLPSLTFGQTNQTGKIFGTVTDSSGATVAGANVTITSPAMIVPQSMKTDPQGAYHFELVPLGVYTLTVDQPGFSKFVRANIEVTAGFSAEIGVQLAVGQISQTVEVSAAGPVVDTTSTHIDTSISSNVLSDELPLTRTTKDFVSVAPGVTPTVPNLSGGDIPSGSYTAYGLTGQTTMLIEGINTRKSSSSAEGDIDFPTLEEFQLIPTAGNAEVETPGLYMNAIVKSGGNDFHGRAEYTQETNDLESSNITPYLRSHGVTSDAGVTHVEDVDANFGGPIIKDRWWFFAGGHGNFDDQKEVGFVNANGVPIIESIRSTNFTGKSTFQLNKGFRLIGFFTQNTVNYPLRNGSATTPLLSTVLYHEPVQEYKGEIQGTPTPHLVLDFYLGHHLYQANYTGNPDPQNIPTITEASGYVNGPTLGQDHRARRQTQATGSLSYVPSWTFWGTHEFKVGYTWMFMWTGTDEPEGIHGNYQLQFDANGNPTQINLYNYPLTQNRENLDDGGAYVQDSWKLAKRLTLNVGLRFDSFIASVPTQTQPAGTFGGLCNASFCSWVQSAPGSNIWTGLQHTYQGFSAGSWTGVAPRIGGAWDIFGNGRAVFKGSYGRYDWTPGDDFASPFNFDEVTINSFRWTATTGCVPGSVNNGNCAAVINPSLPSASGNICTFSIASTAGCDYIPGTVNLNPNGPDHLSQQGGNNGAGTKLANSILNPNLKEQYSNEFQGFIESQVAPSVLARFGVTWVHSVNTWLQTPIPCSNATSSNPCIPFSAWTQQDTFLNQGPLLASCELSPVSKCPAGAAGTPFTVYDLPSGSPYTSALYSTTQYVNTPNDNSNHVSVFEATVTKRSSRKSSLIANFTAIRNHNWINAGTSNQGAQPIATNPNQLYFPLDTTWNWQARLTGNYRLPKNFDFAATLQILSGIRRLQQESVSGLNAGTIVIPVTENGQISGPVRTLLNVRLSRDFKFEHRGTLRPTLEVLNIMNSSSVWAYTTANSSANFYNISSLTPPRIARLGLVYAF